MFKKNLVIGSGGVISLLVFMVVAGVLVLALTSGPVPTSSNTAQQQTESSH